MGCRGCAGTARYLLRDCGSAGPQPAANVFLLCGHDSVSPHIAPGTCPRLCLRAKDHLKGTKVSAFPSLCAPQKVQAGSAAVWRPPSSGDQEGDGRPGYPRRSGRPSERVRAVCGYV